MLPSSLVYRLCRFLNSRRAVDRGVATVASPSEQESAERYFWYEVEKAPAFDRKFRLDLSHKRVLEIGSGYGGYLLHVLRAGAAFACGIEIDEPRRAESLRLLRKHYDRDNYRVLEADACDMHEIESSSIDLVVSDATLEHVRRLGDLLRETARVLKPGGRACMSTSPLWFSWNGGHTTRYIPIPWSHVIFSDRTILEVLETERKNGDFPRPAMDNIITIYKTIGKLSLAKLRSEIRRSPLDLVRFRHTTGRRLTRELIRLPLLEEIFAGNVSVTLTKPALGAR
jgi:SAM-dependent methyltransferase